MADHQAILEEEFEVLESIFPDELEKVDDNEVRIRVEPEEEVTGHPLTLALVVTYPPTYPDVIPDMSLEEIDEEMGTLREGEDEEVLIKLREVAEESLGMAMTFTIATAAREALSELIVSRIAKEEAAEAAKTKAYEEEEARKTRGTPLTKDLYIKWREAYRAEVAAKRVKAEEDRVRGLPAKEREEWRRRRDRLSGRQLFETSKVSATSDEALIGAEDATSVDVSKYSREERDRLRWEEEQEGAGIALDESDDE